jgi:nucleotide-binding universal stress UspA family protein
VDKHSLIQTAVVPLDGTPLTERVLPFATRLARIGAVKLVLVRAHLPDDDRLDLRLAHPELGPAERASLERAEAEAMIMNLAQRLRQAGLDAVGLFREGAAARVIQGVAAETKADLILMATHADGLVGRFFLGSVADEVVRNGSVPVLMITARCQHPWPGDRQLRVLVPLDGSSLAERALMPAMQLVSTIKGQLVLLTVLNDTRSTSSDSRAESATEQAAAQRQLDVVATRLQAAGLSVNTRVSVGAVGASIVHEAAMLDADLIALATHGRSGLARLLTGSVARQVVEVADRPVLLVSPRRRGQRLARAKPVSPRGAGQASA